MIYRPTLLNQLAGSKTCGHCCVAMATGQPLADVIARIGHERGTTMPELYRAAIYFGLVIDPGLTRSAHAPIPDRAILRYRYGRPAIKDSHWVLYWNGTIFDPSYPRAYLAAADQRQMVYDDTCRVTSFSEVHGDVLPAS